VRVAVLDIGTNTILLLIAEMRNGKLVTIVDHHAIARLGEGVDRTRRISVAAYQRFIAVLHEHKAAIEENHCDKIVGVATSAMRDAENRDEIIARTHADTGIEIELLSGDDEARWTFRGSIAGMALHGKVGVVDIGGGSTEIAYGVDDQFQDGASMDIGAVRLTERILGKAPIDSTRLDAAQSFVRTALNGIDKQPLQHLVAVAGTPTTLAAMEHNLKIFDVNTIHGDVLTRTAVEELLDVQCALTMDELIERYPVVNPARADILPAGTLILREVMDYLEMSEVTISTQGLRYGIALRELR
jgi:exopolyphosphatase / guanosine-5'-triphosphate,3'-diphosphate pyrophosphatase